MRLLSWFFRRMMGAKTESQFPDALHRAGLDEETLRRMDPDDRVAALEKANLDPYDYIYLAY